MAKQKRTKPAKRKGVKATMLNLPIDIRDWLDQRAADEGRTLTVLISRALRAEMAAHTAGERRD